MELKEFFLVALPGLEDIVESEVRRWFPQAECVRTTGGVTVRTTFAQGLSMNLVLKTPTRILVRAAQFTAKDFPKLFNVIKDYDWSKWVQPQTKIQVSAATTRSRLKIKSRIEETVEKAWMKSLGKSSNQDILRVYARIVDNLCTMSLDTSGDRLHKRGQRKFIGEAPLRETFAAALLQLTEKYAPNEKNVEVIDPMMGSGVFLSEAALRDQVIESRDFNFDHFVVEPDLVAMQIHKPNISKFIGFESDAKTFKAAQQNLKSQTVEFIHRDFFEAEKIPVNGNFQRWVVNNPPYGERLKIDEPLAQFYAKLFRATEEKLSPDLATFLLPAKASGRLELPSQWKVLEKRRLSNGGIPVVAFIFGRK